MTVDPAKPPRFTIEEYLRREADSIEKHEYLDGRIIAMAGGTPQHSLIIANVIGELRQRLKGKSCRVYDSNLRIRVPSTTLYMYPDLSVVCGPPEFDAQDRNRTTVTNPRLLVEVLSPARGGVSPLEKFRQSLTIGFLQEYVLMAQDAPFVQTFLRRGDGTWLMTPVEGLDAVAKLQSLDIEVPLCEAYAGAVFPPEPEPGTMQPF